MISHSNGKAYKIAGLMSGTSLDGLDLAFCIFTKSEDHWKFDILHAETIEYSAAEKDILKSLMKESAETLTFHDFAFGRRCAEDVNRFMSAHTFTPDLISSHGHTIFHQPEKGFTLQIGSGAVISALTGLPVVSDLRSMDVAAGGQGAPLVPIGDKLLFAEYEMCLNLGGIANISYDDGGKRIAFDICPVNIVLNALANEKSKDYDEGGELAASGRLNSELLEKLNDLEFYDLDFPKSLGKEWIDSEIFPLIRQADISIADKLHTFCHHITFQIRKAAERYQHTEKGIPPMLITGGGAFNKFLTDSIQKSLQDKVRVIIPDEKTIMFKEALIFAFLGLLRVLNEPNCLASVTGAKQDLTGGALYGDFSRLLNK